MSEIDRSSLLPPHCLAQGTAYCTCSKILAERRQFSFQQGFLFVYLSSIRAAFQEIFIECLLCSEAIRMSKEDQVSALLEFTSSREEMSKETNKYKVLWGRAACPDPGWSGELFGSIMNLNLKYH